MLERLNIKLAIPRQCELNLLGQLRRTGSYYELAIAGFQAGRSGPSIAGVAEGRPASLREISAELAVRGFINERGNFYSAASINSML